MTTNSITCKPIENLVNLLVDNGFRMMEKKVSDYHFHELNIKMTGETNNCPVNIEIEGIKRHTDNMFFCSCHWSSVEIVNKM